MTHTSVRGIIARNEPFDGSAAMYGMMHHRDELTDKNGNAVKVDEMECPLKG